MSAVAGYGGQIDPSDPSWRSRHRHSYDETLQSQPKIEWRLMFVFCKDPREFPPGSDFEDMARPSFLDVYLVKSIPV